MEQIAAHRGASFDGLTGRGMTYFAILGAAMPSVLYCRVAVWGTGTILSGEFYCVLRVGTTCSEYLYGGMGWESYRTRAWQRRLMGRAWMEITFRSIIASSAPKHTHTHKIQ